VIPPIYKPATWRCTLPVDKETEDLAIGFNVGEEEVRLRLSGLDADRLADTLRLAICDRFTARESTESRQLGIQEVLVTAMLAGMCLLIGAGAGIGLWAMVELWTR